MSLKGLIIAAPHSNSGKTFITLSLLRALKNASVNVASAKVGPDYIDPPFHSLAGGHTCLNIDGWAMRSHSLGFLFKELQKQADMVICEGAMGLFDGAISLDDHDGSSADLARRTGWPVVLVIDASSQARSVCALIKGFVDFDPAIDIAGVLFNKVGGPSHKDILEKAMQRDLPEMTVLGYVERRYDLELPSRHLGLVQAEELEKSKTFLSESAKHIARFVDLEKLVSLARPYEGEALKPDGVLIKPLGQRMAIARDLAFGFIYPSLLENWQQGGCELSFFSPINDEAPDENVDAIYLPGGYPELHAAVLSSNKNFKSTMQKRAEEGCQIYGECGGYMTLGKYLTNAQGETYEMLGLLDLETSFAKRKLHLGYRQAALSTDCILGQKGDQFRAHEFHYTSILKEEGQALFNCQKSDGQTVGEAGLVNKNVQASFIHLIDRA